MAELNLKHFLFQVVIWLVVAVGVLSIEGPFNLPRVLLGSLLLTLFLGFVAFRLFWCFDREQRFIAIGVTLSSSVVLLLLTVKFYWFDIELKALHFIGIFLLPLVVSALTNGWQKIKK
jgi:1,4-dihydroxy-2-naphthoate octaprenyltransferase